MAQVLDSPSPSPTHSPIPSPRNLANINPELWRRMSTNQQGNSSSTNGSSSNILFAAQEDSGENSNQSLLVDTASRQSCSQSQGHNNNNNSSSNNNINNHQNSPLLMEQSQSQSQLSQSQSQAMSEMLTQNAADFTQMTQDGDNENFSLSPFPPNTPVKPEEVPWGRLMPCSGGKAIELLPKAPPNSKRGAATTSRQQQQLFSILGMQNIHPFDQFNEFWLGRSVKCDFAISRPKKSTTIENADDGVIKEEKLEEWCYGLISNKHCRIYCALSEDAQSRGSTAGMEVWVEDSSNNGTTINQTILLKRGQKRLLNPGDEICLLNYETLCRKTLDDAIRQRMLRKHSFVFINVAQHQQPQQQHQQPQSKPRAAVPVPPFTITNSSARSRRGLVDPRAMNYHGNRSAGPWSKRMWQQQPNVPQRSPVPAYAAAAAAPAVNSAFLSGGPAEINPAASNEKGGFGFSNYSSSSRAGFAALANKHAQRNMVTAKLTSSPQRRIEEEYDIRDLLGRGTCGEVRRAIHRTSGQQRAVKIVSLPSPGLMMNTTNKQQQQWQAEARILQTLEHPYIIKLVDVFRADSHLYLVMELSTGGDLFDRIVQRGKYTEDASRRVMRRLLSAVHYIHEDAEIVHRDLKPENILLNASDIDVKITDFGVAKSASGGLKTLVGTPGYLAPEILKRRHTVLGQGRYGKSADLWSLGVILYILLSGTPPFDVDGVQDMDVILQTGNKVQFPAKLWKDISPEAIDLVKHLLVMDPLKRISIREACEHPWVLMEDGDTHRHPLEDPKLLSKTKKRLFSGASPVPTPASNRSKATSGGSKDPVSKRLKLEVESAAQTTRIPEAATVKTCEEANSKAKGDCPSTSTHPSSTDKSDIQQIQSEQVEEEDFRRNSEARDIDKDMHNIDSTSNSKNPPEKTVGITNQREKVSPSLSESLIDRIMQPKSTCNKQKSSTKTLAETSNIVDKKPLEKKSESTVVEDEHEKSEMEIETALPARDPENSDNGNVGSPNQSSMALEEIQTPEEEKRRKVTPGVSNKEKFPTNTSSTKFSQATQHFEPGSFTVAAVAAQKPKRSKKSKEKGLVEAAELEEDEICSQFSDDDTESITSFGDAINIEKETQIEEEKDISKPSGKTYKQSTLAPLSGTSSVSAKKEKAPTSKTTRSSKASKPKVAKTAAKPRKSAAAEKKTTTTTAKKSISRTINDKKSGTSKDSSTKEAASSDGVGGGEEGRKKSPKQTTLSKWFQLSKQSKSDSS